MLSVGIFTTPKTIIQYYEVKEGSYYRIDFVKDNAAFNVDPNSVIYSLVRNKDTYTYGNSDIYEEFERFKAKIEHAPMKSQKESKWFNGEYHTIITSESTKLGYSSRTEKVNNQIHEYSMEGDGYSLTCSVISRVFDVKTRPLNFAAYKKLTLAKSSLQQTSDSLFYTIDYLKAKYDLDYIDDPANDFIVATDIDTARQRLKFYDECDYPFRAFDTETTGLDICLYGEDKMVGIILGSNTHHSTYFPFRHDGDFNLPMDFLPELMEVVLKHQDITVAHNKKFDREVMLAEGYDLRMKWCTMQLSIVLDPTIGKGIHGLKENSDREFHQHTLELDEIFVDPRNIQFQKLTPELIRYYACPDGTNPLRLMEVWLKRLKDSQMALWQLECDLSDLKADQEFEGIRVDTKRFEHQYKNCNYVLDILLTSFRRLTHEDGNIDSAQVMSNLLYNKMHCPILLRTDTGMPSTATAAIKKLAKQKPEKPYGFTENLVDLDGKVIIKADDLNNSKYPALVILAKYKEYVKLKTAFYARFERTMKTGRIFFWVNQNGAATGRQSSPMHQLPPALKDCILPDTDEHNFWGPDYSQIELRMIAYAAGETELIDMAKDPDNDIHRVIGSLISGKEMWAITPEERSVGKRRNFGVVYLISKFGLAGQLKGPGYTAEDVAFAEQQLNAFFKRFKRIDRYIKKNGIDVQKKGYTQTLWYKRKRMFPQIFDPNLDPAKRASILRMANNVPIQGTAADYMKCAETLFDGYIREKGWNKRVNGFPLVRIMLSCHDEVLISAHRSIPYEEIVKMITTCMEIPIEGAPPFFAQPAKMDNWGGHSDDAAAMPIPFRDKIIKDYDATHKSIFHHSTFELHLTPEAMQDINSSTEPQPALVDKWLSAATLQYFDGDYIKEARPSDVKTALMNYVRSGFTKYTADDYIEILNQYRADKLHDYMTGLIHDYGTDYKAVGEHVRHPALTFQLLELYDRKIPYDMEHADRITEAARLYIEDLMNSSQKVTLIQPEKKEYKIADKDLFVEQLDIAVNLDRDGNVVFEDSADEGVSDLDAYFSDDPEEIIGFVESKPIYVWKIGDNVSIDVAGLDEERINKVLSYVWEHKDTNGFYRVFLLYKGQLVDTKMQVEDINDEELNGILIAMHERSFV